MKAEEAIKQRRDLTDEELNSLQDVCEGKIARKDSLVSDAKFDLILSSLQGGDSIEKILLEKRLEIQFPF